MHLWNFWTSPRCICLSCHPRDHKGGVLCGTASQTPHRHILFDNPRITKFSVIFTTPPNSRAAELDSAPTVPIVKELEEGVTWFGQTNPYTRSLMDAWTLVSKEPMCELFRPSRVTTTESKEIFGQSQSKSCVSKSSELIVVIFRVFLYQLVVHSIDSPIMIGNFSEALNFNCLFLKPNRFMCQWLWQRGNRT